MAISLIDLARAVTRWEAAIENVNDAIAASAGAEDRVNDMIERAAKVVNEAAAELDRIAAP